jgi:large subunit ribosomal protein L15
VNITDVNKSVKGHPRRRRKGRGAASGLGKTAGRGQKGLGARAGGSVPRGYVGGQTPLRERLPKRGFNNAAFRTEYLPINVAQLEALFEAGDEVTVASLKVKGVTVRRGQKIKILGAGELGKKLTVQADAVSKSAREKIEKAGGTVTVPKTAAPADEASDAAPAGE